MPVARTWCARCRYRPDLDEFLLGTVIAEGYEDARAQLEAVWRRLVPHPLPAEFSPVPGEVVFLPRDGG